MYLRGRVTLLIAIGVAWWTVAGGAEIETLNVRSAPKVLGPLNVETTAEHKNVAPNGETIITATFEGWLDEEEPSEERPSMMKRGAPSPVRIDQSKMIMKHFLGRTGKWPRRKSTTVPSKKLTSPSEVTMPQSVSAAHLTLTSESSHSNQLIAI